jgi:DNA topoisomerase III
LSESELIELMEKFGIGTDASMATHINNICERDYVQIKGGSRKLEPTKMGLALIHGF